MDSKLRFMDVSIGQPGSVHDAMLLRTSPAWTHRQEWLPAPYYLLADSGYFLTPELLCVFPRKQAVANDAMLDFNEHTSSSRGVVERAFGVLKARFRFMFDPSFARKDAATYAQWFTAACILHNMSIRVRSADDGVADDAATATQPVNADGSDVDIDLANTWQPLYDAADDEDHAAEQPHQQPVQVAAVNDVFATGTSLLQGRRRRLRVAAALGFNVAAMTAEVQRSQLAAAVYLQHPLG